MPAATLTFGDPDETVTMITNTLYSMGFTKDFDGGFVEMAASLPATPDDFEVFGEARPGGQVFFEYRSPGTKLRLRLIGAKSGGSVNFEATAIA